MKKPSRNTSRSKLIKRLDEVAKELAKIRDKYTCQRCGKQVDGCNAHGSHVVPVSQGNKLRWDLNNIKTLCYHCHMNWWHKDPTAAGEWFKEKFPERWYYLQNERGIAIYKEYQLEELLKNLTELRDRLKGGA